MSRGKREELLEQISSMLARIEPDEKILLFDLAGEVPEEGIILEIGSAYGGSAACLWLGSKEKVQIILVDNFTYGQFGKTSQSLLMDNLCRIGVNSYIAIIYGDSRTVPIIECRYFLVHIDGCHNYEVVKSDLRRFAVLAPVVVIHDYPPEARQPGVTKAVDEWLELHPEYHKAEAVNRYIVLRRKQKEGEE